MESVTNHPVWTDLIFLTFFKHVDVNILYQIKQENLLIQMIPVLVSVNMI